MNDTLPALLHRPSRLPDESLPSFLIRLAQENFYHSPTMVLQLCRERLTGRDTITRPTRTETYRVLSALTGTTADELYSASAQRFATTVIPPTYEPCSVELPSGKTGPILQGFFLREQVWPETDVQFCPLCLRQAAYHRVSWMPLAVAVCLHHQCLLVRGCPHCTENISVGDLLKAQCPNCNLSLTEIPVTPVVPDFSQAMLQAWLGLCKLPLAKPHYSLPDISPVVLYRVLDGLRRAMMSIQHSWDYLHQTPRGISSPLLPCRWKGDITPAKAYILYATAFKALVNWPHGFYDFLEAYKRRDDLPATDYIQDDFGYIYRTCLEKQWLDPAFHFIQQAFEQYLSDHYPATPTLARLRRFRNRVSDDGKTS